MPALQIYDRRERALVTAADAVLRAAAIMARQVRGRRAAGPARRILLLRLERIGDLLMTLPAIADIRAAAPDADIDLIVGSWNREIAERIAGVTRVLTLDASWLAREGGGLGLPALMRAARPWRGRRYDVAVNFEPDIRSNLLLALSGAAWRVGYRSAGGGPMLDVALDYDQTAHTTDNARRLAAAVTGRGPGTPERPLLSTRDEERQRARALLDGSAVPAVAMHVPGGRPVKQWDPDRFIAVAHGLIERRGATVVLTGGPGDRLLVQRVAGALPSRHVVDASSGADLLMVAALLERCELLITGDTGPMHLAAALGVPIVAVFGPSDPRRYAPRGRFDRVVRVELPCAPCNRIRLPPARCTGRIPDCLALITPDQVLDTAIAVLDECRRPSGRTEST